METLMGEFAVTYSGTEANEILLEPVFMDEDILSSFRVMPNVVNKKKMAFASKLEKIVRKYTGCGFKPTGGLQVTERCVEVERQKFDLEVCIDEFLDTVYEELLNRGVRIADLTGTILEEILLTRIRQALKLDFARMYYFSANSDPDPNYDQMDGFWRVHAPELVAQNLVPYFNTGSGAALNNGDGIDILRAVEEAAPNQLKGLPNAMKRHYVAGTVYNQYVTDLENSGGGDFGVLAMVNGIQTPFFRGVQVVPQWRWNEIMEQDFASPNVHYALYTTPQNMVIGTDLINAADDVMVWYDPKDEKLFAKGRWKFGGNYVHESLFSLGY